MQIVKSFNNTTSTVRRALTAPD